MSINCTSHTNTHSSSPGKSRKSFSLLLVLCINNPANFFSCSPPTYPILNRIVAGGDDSEPERPPRRAFIVVSSHRGDDCFMKIGHIASHHVRVGLSLSSLRLSMSINREAGCLIKKRCLPRVQSTARVAFSRGSFGALFRFIMLRHHRLHRFGKRKSRARLKYLHFAHPRSRASPLCLPKPHTSREESFSRLRSDRSGEQKKNCRRQPRKSSVAGNRVGRMD